MDFLSQLFKRDYGHIPGWFETEGWAMISAILQWDIVKGGLTFTMAVLIGGYAIVKIKEGFNR